MMSAADNRRRTHQERIEAIFDFIEKQADVFPKSRLNEIGLNPRTAEMWLKLIEYIQSQPRIRLIQTDHNMLVEKVEGKYQALMRKMSADESVPFERRMQYLTDYLKSLYALEKSRTFARSTPQGAGNKDISLDPQEIVKQMLEAFDTFALLDPIFYQHAQMIKDVEFGHSIEEQFYALAKWQKEVIMNKDFQADVKRILDKEFLRDRLGRIAKQFPDFYGKLKRAKQTITAYYSFLHEKFADWFFDAESL